MLNATLWHDIGHDEAAYVLVVRPCVGEMAGKVHDFSRILFHEDRLEYAMNTS